MQDKRPEKTTKYHDAFAALVCKSVKNFSFDNCSVDVAFTLILRVHIEDAEEAEYIKKRFGFRLNEVECPIFPDFDPEDEDKKSKEDRLYKRAYDAKSKLMRFVLRMETTAQVDPNILSAEVEHCPFDYLPAELKFELTSINDPIRNCDHRFNFKMHKNPLGNVQFSFKKNCDKLAEYNVDVDTSIVYPVQENKGADSGIHYWPIVVYKLSLYRDPTYLIQSTLINLLLLNFLTLAVFGFEGDDYSGKLGYIATLFLGLVAFIPSIRSGLPNLPSQTLLEKQIYVTICLLFLGLLDSVFLRIIDLQGYSTLYTGNETTPGLIVSSITFAVACLIALMSILFWAYRYLRFKTTNPRDPLDVVECKQDSADFAPIDWYPAEDWAVDNRKKLPKRNDIYFKDYKYDNKPKKGKRDEFYDDYGYYRL